MRVDFNRRGRNGYVVGSTARADGPIDIDDLVELYQPGEDDMNPVGSVVSIDENGRVELDVIWNADTQLSSVLAAIVHPGLYASAPTNTTFVASKMVRPGLGQLVP
jgi:hypothetical protein